jgi:putative membrane protein
MRYIRDVRLAALGVCSAALLAVSACSSTGHTAQPAAASVAHVSRTDRSWIHRAHQANLAEMEVGHLAGLDGGSKAIQSAGAMLIRDHQALDSELIQVAKKLRLTLPTSPTVQQTTTADRLSKENGQRFDTDFTASMLTAHRSMIAATRYEIAHGSAAAVVGLAKQALPVLVKHLKTMRAAATPAG